MKTYSRAVSHALNAEAHERRQPPEQNANFKRAHPQQGSGSGYQGGNFNAQKKQRWGNQVQGPTGNRNVQPFRGPNQGPKNFQGPRPVQVKPQEIPVCAKCGAKHLGDCFQGTCFNCGEFGHRASACLKPKQNPGGQNPRPGPYKGDDAKKKVSGIVFAMTEEEAEDSPDTMTGMLDLLKHVFVRFLIPGLYIRLYPRH